MRTHEGGPGRSTSDGTRELPGTREAAEAWESLFRAQVALMRRFQRDDVWGDLTIREYDVLFTLSRCPDGTARLRDLGENSLLSQPSLSRMVERLEQAGLVRRGPVAGDARGVAVGLTPEGRRVQREIGRQHVRTIRRLVGGALDTQELATLRALTDKLRLAQAQVPDESSDA
ncbi:MarR family winged helix-turn-helix transcriptional regulator [Cellulomonas fengjieae]|uniref:MarR family winged helix-turn-helix transcriptional regulator n=1 Tax=Cellulomonas fengjieae TaxID=2819978 RepID=UPI001AAFA4A8|nr:MarR family winged helix-turn-helix transcriptional regulator [Cellulomonas fengjieae]MBO3101453.1 winged helix-turn-helix transcriptional regulator [Cellulomonas fengjieae]